MTVSPCLDRIPHQIVACAIAFVLAGCSINRTVEPVASSATVETIYIHDNPRVLMSGLVDEIATQIRELGFEAEVYRFERPTDAVHHLTYTANWRWDFAMTLVYFRSTLHERGKPIGRVEYDARDGLGNFRRYGQTGEKIRPLLVQLFENVARTPADR